MQIQNSYQPLPPQIPPSRFIDLPKPKGVMPFKVGKLLAVITGGPYVAKPPEYAGVKMAAEIDFPCDISIPTKDFSTPDQKLMIKGLMKTIHLIMEGRPVYVGCMGGIGRTGLFLGALAKIMSEAQKIRKKKSFNPRDYVRQHYLSHAIETKEQEQYLAQLPVRELAEYVLYIQRFIES